MIEIGKRIPKKYEEIFKGTLTIDNLHEISEDSNYSFSTVRGMYYGKTILTEDNSILVHKMVAKSLKENGKEQMKVELIRRELINMQKALITKKEIKRTKK